MFLSSGHSSEVVSTSLDNINRLHRDNSTVGVGNTSGSSVGNLGSVDIRGVSGDNSSVSMSYQTMGVSSSIRVVSIGENMSQLAKVCSTCSSNSGGVSGHNSSVGESHQSSVGDGHTGCKNQKLHVEGWV